MSSDLPETRPTVILRHTLPDGSHHIDWLIARDPAGEEPLISFRLDRPPDRLLPNESVRAERLFDHRPIYLSYEGPISDNRGTVERLRQGRAWLSTECEDRFVIHVKWVPAGKPSASRLAARAEEPPFWQIVCLEFGRL